MGKLYDYCTRVQEHIEASGLDVVKTRGQLALKAGFLITFVDPDEPDDPAKIAALRSAAKEVLDFDLG